MINNLLKTIGLFLLIAISTACTPQADIVKDNPYGIRAYSQTELDSIIENHPYTIIYAWNIACVFCRESLKEDVIPYLSVKPDSIGFISITSSKYNQVFHFMKEHDCKIPTFIYEDTTNSYYGFYRYLFPSILKNYEHPQSDGASRTILCNRKKEILNIDDELSYDAHGDTIPGVHYRGIHWVIEDLNKMISK